MVLKEMWIDPINFFFTFPFSSNGKEREVQGFKERTFTFTLEHNFIINLFLFIITSNIIIDQALFQLIEKQLLFCFQCELIVFARFDVKIDNCTISILLLTGAIAVKIRWPSLQSKSHQPERLLSEYWYCSSHQSAWLSRRGSSKENYITNTCNSDSRPLPLQINTNTYIDHVQWQCWYYSTSTRYY